MDCSPPGFCVHGRGKNKIRVIKVLPWLLSGKDPPAVKEMHFEFLGRVDPLEKEMATHSSILAWEIPWTQQPGRVESMGSRGAPGKSGLHASGEGERVIAPEPWEGTLASRRVEEDLSRSFPG